MSEVENGADYSYPIIWIEGMEVVSGLWYTNGEDIWAAIASGIPANFEDTNFFNIIKL